MTSREANRRLVKRGGQFAVGPIVRAVGVLALLPLMTRVFEPEALGVVSTAQVVTNVLVAVGALGLHSAAMREYFGTDEVSGNAGLARSLSVAAVVASAFFAVTAHVLGPSWVPILGDVVYRGPLVIAVFVTVPMSLFVVSQNLLRAEDRPAPFSVSVLIATLGGQLAGIGLAATGKGTPTEYLTGVALGFCAGALLSAVAVGLRSELLRVPQLRAGLRLGLPTIPHSLGIFLLQMGDRVVLKRVHGFESVGRYQVAYLVGSVGIVLVLAFAAAWTPMIFRIESDRERWEVLQDTTGLAHRLIALVSVGIILLSPLAMRIAAPNSYGTDGLNEVVLILAPSALFYVSFQASSMVLFHLRRTTYLGLISLVSAVCNFALNLVLVPRWGLHGAAVATTVSYALWATAVRSASSRLAPVRWSDEALVQSIALVGLTLGFCALIGDGTVALAIRFVVALGAGYALWRLVRQQGRPAR